MLPFLGGLLSSVASGAMSLFGQQSANDANSAMAANRYQVASQDMQKAGLNPAMMFGSGGPAPMAPQQNAMAGAGEAVSKSVGTALQSQIQAKTVDNLTQQLANMKAQQVDTLASAAVKKAMTPGFSARSALLAQEVPWGVQNQQNKAFILKSDADSAASDAVVRKNAALSARNQMGMNPTARKVIDQSDVYSKGASNVIDPIASVIGAAHGAASTATAVRRMLGSGRSMRSRVHGNNGDFTDFVNDNVSDDYFNAFMGN